MKSRTLYLILSLILLYINASAQERDFTIRGKVLDSATNTALAQVSVIEMAGLGGTLTDDQGYFTIAITETSRLKFSRLGYKDRNIAAAMLSGDQHITIRIAELSIAIPEVNVSAQKALRHDSLSNRADNKEIFEASRKQSVSVFLGTMAGLSISPSRIYDNYLNPRLKRLRHYRRVLEQNERLTYIVNRFTPRLVTSITGLKGPELISFMKSNRPDYDWLHANSDYELYEFIERRFKTVEKAPSSGR